MDKGMAGVGGGGEDNHEMEDEMGREERRLSVHKKSFNKIKIKIKIKTSLTLKIATRRFQHAVGARNRLDVNRCDRVRTLVKDLLEEGYE